MGGKLDGSSGYEKIEFPPTPQQEEKQQQGKPANLESTCPAPGVFQAVDLSQYCTQRFLDAMKYLGVKTIIRYYDWPGSPTLPQKIPTASELALIKKNGFSFCGVFQHSNNRIASFTKERGIKDAGVALDLAKKWGQPKGSGVYFGVDFDPMPNEFSAVREYAQIFAHQIRAAGFRVGAYGSGYTLQTLLDAKHIDLAWLSMSTGFLKSKEFDASKRWNLKQVKDRNCGGINCDFDYVNPEKPDFGQWELP
jgi:hypothetical protein